MRVCFPVFTAAVSCGKVARTLCCTLHITRFTPPALHNLMPAQAQPIPPAAPGGPGRAPRADGKTPLDEVTPENMEAEIARQVALRTRDLTASLARYQTMVDLATENICVGQDG